MTATGRGNNRIAGGRRRVAEFPMAPSWRLRARFLRYALFADPATGVASLSWRIKCALEARGDTVYWFTPASHPFLFDGQCIRIEDLQAFLEGGHVDVIGLCDGVTLSDPGFVSTLAVDPRFADEPVRTIRFIERIREDEVAQALEGCDGIVCFDDAADPVIEFRVKSEDNCSLPQVVMPTLRDDTVAATPLANTIAYQSGVLCLQQATSQRIAAYNASPISREETPRYFYSPDWPDCPPTPCNFSELVYAARSGEILVFDDGDQTDDLLTPAMLAFLISCGARPVLLATHTDEDGFPGALQHVVDVFEAGDVQPFSPMLEKCMLTLFSLLNTEGKPVGEKMEPRCIVPVLGYFGCANFGDEYILETIDRRLRLKRPGLSVIAISENPEYTLCVRGIYALTLSQETAVNVCLRYSCAALTVAGLLFDEGMRWGSGYADLFTTMAHSTIPGIAAYTALARLNGAVPVFYGIGAGPLLLPESRGLVRLMGAADALFLARDPETAALLADCGVPDGQIKSLADTAFLGLPVDDDPAAAWLAEEGLDGKRFLAVSLRTYENLSADFAQRCAEALNAALADGAVEAAVFCLLDPADRSISEAVIESMAHRDRTHIYDPTDSLDGIYCLLRHAYAGFSMRYHCSLLLNAAGTPCVGIGYLPKVVSLYSSMGCDTLLLETDADAQAMKAALEALFGDFDGWKATVEAHCDELRKLAAQSEDELLAVIDRVSPGKAFAVPAPTYLLGRTPGRIALEDARTLLQEKDRTIAGLESRIQELEQTATDLACSRSYRFGHTVMSALARILRPFRSKEN